MPVKLASWTPGCSDTWAAILMTRILCLLLRPNLLQRSGGCAFLTVLCHSLSLARLLAVPLAWSIVISRPWRTVVMRMRRSWRVPLELLSSPCLLYLFPRKALFLPPPPGFGVARRMRRSWRVPLKPLSSPCLLYLLPRKAPPPRFWGRIKRGMSIYTQKQRKRVCRCATFGMILVFVRVKCL